MTSVEDSRSFSTGYELLTQARAESVILPKEPPPGIMEVWEEKPAPPTPFSSFQKCCGALLLVGILIAVTRFVKLPGWTLLVALGVSLAFGMLLYMSAKNTRYLRKEHWRAVSPDTDWAQCFQVSIRKFEVLFLGVLAPAMSLYLDWSSDVKCLIGFQRNHQFQFFKIQLAILLASATYQGFETYKEVGQVRFAVLAFFQVLPLLYALRSLYALQWAVELDVFEKFLIDSHALKLLATVGFFEAVTESTLSALVQVYAMVHEVDSEAEKVILMFSAAMSILTVAKACSIIDMLGYTTRLYEGGALVVGTAQVKSIRFVLVVCYRITNVASRLLMFPLFQETFHEEFQLFGMSTGAFWLWLVDFAAQAGLCWMCTRSKYKLPYALASTISPMEPLLHGGAPVFTTNINLAGSLHILELAFVTIAAVAIKGVDKIQDIFNDDMLILKAFVVSFILQCPLFFIIRRCCSYKATPGLLSQDADQFLDMDITDRNVPVKMLTASWKEPRNSDGALILPNKKLANIGAYVVALVIKFPTQTISSLDLELNDLNDHAIRLVCEALKSNSSISSLILNQNRFGKDGCDCIATVLMTATTGIKEIEMHGNAFGPEGMASIAAGIKENTSLELIYLNGNGIGKEGAVTLADSLAANKTIQRVWLGDNNIGPEGGRALVEVFEQSTNLKNFGPTECFPGNGFGEEIEARFTAENKRKEEGATEPLQQYNHKEALNRTTLEDYAAVPSIHG